MDRTTWTDSAEKQLSLVEAIIPVCAIIWRSHVWISEFFLVQQDNKHLAALNS